MKPTLYYVVTLWLIVWSQVLLNHFLGGSWFSVDIVLIATLYFGLSRGPLVGQVMGLVWGLLIDASSLGLMGVHTFLYALAGYIAGMLSRQLDESKGWTQALFTLSASVFYTVLYLLLTRLFSPTGRTIVVTMFAQPVINALVAPIVFAGLRWWGEVWSMRPVEN